MLTLSADDVTRSMDYASLVEALRAGFRSNINTPVRHHHTIGRPDQADATMLLMPAWHEADSTSNGSYVGIKMVTVYPDNEKRLNKPSILGTYILLDGESGAILALLDGPTLTVWRTACASALAADYLARSDASNMLMVGTGALAEHLIRAHCAVRPIETVTLWGRSSEKAEALANKLSDMPQQIEIAEDREAAARQADLISCATMSADPLISGDWLKAGAHLDLVGAYRPDMRESDDAAIRKAEVYVDTIGGATKEGGDITQPLANGALCLVDIKGDLFGLCRGEATGRCNDGAITLFKSVGTAIEDLVAAQYIFEKQAD